MEGGVGAAPSFFGERVKKRVERLAPVPINCSANYTTTAISPFWLGTTLRAIECRLTEKSLRKALQTHKERERGRGRGRGKERQREKQREWVGRWICGMLSMQLHLRCTVDRTRDCN